MGCSLVWFKRDLRVEDHQAFFEASQHGPVLPLYILEPELWLQPDMSYRQYQFLLQSISDLNKQLSFFDAYLIIRVGNAEEILNQIIKDHHVSAVYSHQETWNFWTYQRDIKIQKMLQKLSVPWHEYQQHGVIRRLKDRNSWASQWLMTMSKPVISLKKNSFIACKIDSEILPSAKSLGLEDDGCVNPQKGGRFEGLKVLESFLMERSQQYIQNISSPLGAMDHCSRLSPYLAFGCLSMKEVFHAVEKKQRLIKNDCSLSYDEKSKWLFSLKSFSARLRWHCHFIQKLEDEPRIEFENLHSAYNNVRTMEEFKEHYFIGWKNGLTGFPFVDACMRCLMKTGWLNFRMRAMLMSFASYHLWLNWKETSKYLAQLFVDYEPGIHYSQVQMQSGTTGMNTLRIYNPIKQSMDQDPTGIFIKKWLPELAHYNEKYIHEPWKIPSQLGNYPKPIVDEKEAREKAKNILFSIRQTTEHRVQKNVIVTKHASRKQGFLKRKKPSLKNIQKELPI